MTLVILSVTDEFINKRLIDPCKPRIHIRNYMDNNHHLTLQKGSKIKTIYIIYTRTYTNIETLRCLIRENVKPDAVVAKDGSGQYTTITEAIQKMPVGNGRYVIYVKAGTYNEIVLVPQGKNNIFMYGDGAGQTMVTGDRSNQKGFKTVDSATFGN